MKFKTGDLVKEYNKYWQKYIIYLVVDEDPTMEELQKYFSEYFYGDYLAPQRSYKLLSINNPEGDSLYYIEHVFADEEFEKMI